MPEYKYKAKNVKNGKIVKGVLQAVDEATFYRELERKDLVCIDVREKGNVEDTQLPYKFKLKELSIFCREFAIMMSAGIPIVEVLDKLAARTKKKEKKRVYMYLLESVEKGNTMADSMQKLGKVFPQMLIEMIRIGEASGSLEIVVDKMALYYEKENKSRSKVQTMMIYPIMISIVTLGIMILLFTFVMPKFYVMFEGQELPGITKFFMKVSEVLVNDWMYILLAVVAIAIIFNVFISTKPGRMAFDKFKCSIPVISILLQKGVISRFADTMFILQSSGIVILEALEICAATITNTYLQSKLHNCREEVQKGETLSKCMEREKLFEDLVWAMISTGEETGNADEMYRKLALYYEEENDMATAKLMAIMEPAIMIVIGSVVGLVVASILVPIYGMYR